MLDGLRENFEIILIVLFLLSAAAYAAYRFTFYSKIKTEVAAALDEPEPLTRKQKKNIRFDIIERHLDTFPKKIMYFFADLFWVLFFVVVVRSFLYEPFIIPSSSMKPGLQIGDIVLVNKYELGLRLPVTNQKITQGRAVKRGDVVVFKYPKNPKISYIKRVIGVAGDSVYYDNRNMIINGQAIKLTPISNTVDEVEITDFSGNKTKKPFDYTVFKEDLFGRSYDIRYADNHPVGYPAREWIVPEGKYLVMGDNRDNSADGREFGFLDDSLMIGHATRVALNVECVKVVVKVSLLLISLFALGMILLCMSKKDTSKTKSWVIIVFVFGFLFFMMAFYEYRHKGVGPQDSAFWSSHGKCDRFFKKIL